MEDKRITLVVLFFKLVVKYSVQHHAFVHVVGQQHGFAPPVIYSSIFYPRTTFPFFVMKPTGLVWLEFEQSEHIVFWRQRIGSSAFSFDEVTLLLHLFLFVFLFGQCVQCIATAENGKWMHQCVKVLHLQRNNRCPLCRKPMNTLEYLTDFQIQRWNMMVTVTLKEEEKMTAARKKRDAAQKEMDAAQKTIDENALKNRFRQFVVKEW